MSITIKRAEGVVEFCTDLALRAEWEAASQRLEEAKIKPQTSRMSSGDVLVTVAREVQDLEAAMREHTLEFRMRALPRKVWQEMCAAHEPRDDVDADDAQGVNTSTFYDALLSAVDDSENQRLASIIGVTDLVTGEAVDFNPATDWLPLADEMSDVQYREFANKIMALNRGVVARPTSRAASRVMAGSEENSKQQSDSASA